jgi:hypothetical protein
MRTHSVLLAMLACIGTSITAADDHQFPDNPGFFTLAMTRLAIEGLTGDEHGNLYTTGRAPPTEDRCPIWQIDPGGAILQVGRDNFPNSAGEINSGGPVGARGKISCMDEPLNIPG